MILQQTECSYWFNSKVKYRKQFTHLLTEIKLVSCNILIKWNNTPNKNENTKLHNSIWIYVEK